jgi:hypothetical protein
MVPFGLRHVGDAVDERDRPNEVGQLNVSKQSIAFDAPVGYGRQVLRDLVR